MYLAANFYTDVHLQPKGMQEGGEGAEMISLKVGLHMQEGAGFKGGGKVGARGVGDDAAHSFLCTSRPRSFQGSYWILKLTKT